MNARQQKRNRKGQVERVVLRAVLMLGLGAAVLVGYLMRGVDESLSTWLPGLVGLAVVGGVTWFGRARTRERWEAAWDAYASDEFEIGMFAPVDDEAELCLAGGR